MMYHRSKYGRQKVRIFAMVGINYLLACISTPFAPGVWELYPAQLLTSLRTSDS